MTDDLRSMVPTTLLGGLDRYVEHRIQPGHFLTAVLENNLMAAFGRADYMNRAAMFDILAYIYNELPAPCHGSPKRVADWLAGRENE